MYYSFYFNLFTVKLNNFYKSFFFIYIMNSKILVLIFIFFTILEFNIELRELNKLYFMR